MPVSSTINIPGETGNVSYLILAGGNPNFSSIFTGIPLYYPGSVITIQETLKLRVAIDNPDVVDVDFGWFYPHKFLGTWQLTFLDDDLGIVPTDEGYLKNEETLIRRYSQYTITSNPDVLFEQRGNIRLDNCNFYTVPDVFLFPGETTLTAGFKLYKSDAVLLGKISEFRAPLADTKFFRQISGVAMNLRPGVSGISIGYRIDIVNDIYTAYDQSPVPTCTQVAASCPVQFTAFLAQGSFRYPDQLSCEAAIASGAASGIGCNPFIYECATDPTQTFTYWVPNAS